MRRVQKFLHKQQTSCCACVALALHKTHTHTHHIPLGKAHHNVLLYTDVRTNDFRAQFSWMKVPRSSENRWSNKESQADREGDSRRGKETAIRNPCSAHAFLAAHFRLGTRLLRFQGRYSPGLYSAFGPGAWEASRSSDVGDGVARQGSAQGKIERLFNKLHFLSAVSIQRKHAYFKRISLIIKTHTKNIYIYLYIILRNICYNMKSFKHLFIYASVNTKV